MTGNIYEKMNDEKLAEAVRKDKEAFASLVRRYEGKIVGFALKMGAGSKESAEDIAQNIFIKVYVNINSFKKGRKFSSWLYGIARNECIDYWRKHKKHQAGVSIEGNEKILSVLASEDDLERSTERTMEISKISGNFSNIPIKYREILVLRFLEDKSYEEMSDILKKPISTIGTLVRRSKEKLKEELGKIKI